MLECERLEKSRRSSTSLKLKRIAFQFGRRRFNRVKQARGASALLHSMKAPQSTSTGTEPLRSQDRAQPATSALYYVECLFRAAPFFLVPRFPAQSVMPVLERFGHTKRLVSTSLWRGARRCCRQLLASIYVSLKPK